MFQPLRLVTEALRAYRFTIGVGVVLVTISLAVRSAPTPYGAALADLRRIDEGLRDATGRRNQLTDAYYRGRGVASSFATTRADGQPLDVSRLRFVDPSYEATRAVPNVESAVGVLAASGAISLWQVDAEAIGRVVTGELAARPSVVAVENVLFQWGTPMFGFYPTVRHRDGRTEQQMWGANAQPPPSPSVRNELNPWGVYILDGYVARSESFAVPGLPAPPSPPGVAPIPPPLLPVWNEIKQLEPAAARAYVIRREAEQPFTLRVGALTVAAVPVGAAAALVLLSAVFADLRRRHLSRVFLCYASEDEAVARRLELALVGERHTVFFAPQRLAGSDEYYRAIRQAIASAEVFVFLLSRASVQPGRFTLTEVAEAERRWPHPKGRVLTVILDSTPASAAPPYLQAVTVLKPAGDAVADASNRIAAMLKAIRRPLDLAVAGTLGAAVLAWVWLVWRR